VNTACSGITGEGQKAFSAIVELGGVGGLHPLRMNQLDAAIVDLQTAQKIRPNQSVAALWKSKRDRDAEGISVKVIQPLCVAYHGGASRQLASEVIHTLEEQ